MAKKDIKVKAGNQPENEKTRSLQTQTADATGELMTTDHGVKINDDQNSL
jgi:catalase